MVPPSSAAETSIAPTGSPPRPRSSLTSIAAPIRPRISITPQRVGLSPTPSRRTRLPGTIVAATMKKAAEERSPGMTISPGSSRSAGRIVTVSPSRPTSAPAAASMRSEWSRVGEDSITRVSPSASSPASSRQDLTWALATGSR